MQFDSKKPCPCCSGKSYANCCKPYHDGALPESALALMRSRYTAYALCLSDYIIDTTHPDNPDAIEHSDLWKKSILFFSQNTRFDKLEILDFKELGKEEAYVNFIAYLHQNGETVLLKEKSHFLKVDGKWLYHKRMLAD